MVATADTASTHASTTSGQTVCLFCDEEIPDAGLGFYEHVETHPACEFRWKDWMIEIPKDHGGA